MESFPGHGPQVSAGSFQHPDGCRPCQLYLYTWSGCRDGLACQYCHLEHESKRQRKRKWRGAADHLEDLVEPLEILPPEDAEDAEEAGFAESAGNHYEVLGVEKDATAAEIKRSYLQMSRKFHPDKNCGKYTCFFQQIN